MVISARPAADDAATLYACDVLDGKVVAGEFVRAASRRHLRDLDEGSARGLTFDVGKAKHHCGFFPAVLTVTEGIAEGKPFHLLPWHGFVVASLFGWQRSDGLRRFRMAWLETGKGQAKSPLMAGIGIDMMGFAGKERSEVYAIAGDKDQANVLFKDAVAMCRATAGTWFNVQWYPGIGSGGRWIATGENGSQGAMYSNNGTTWVPVATPAGTWVKSAYSPKHNRLVSVARGNLSTMPSAGQSMYSDNGGVTWTLNALPANRDWLAVTWASDLEKFVVVGSPMVDSSDQSPVVLLSDDGLTWESAMLGNVDHWWQVKWIRELGLLVAVANNYGANRVMTSPNGTNWTARTPPAADDGLQDIAWSPSLGLLVAIANTGTNRVICSTNGTSWSVWSPSSGAPANQAWRAITWSDADQQFLAVGTSGTGNRVMTTVPASDFVPISNERGTLTLADDTATTIPLPSPGGQMVAFSCAPGNPSSAAFPSFIVQVRSNSSTAPAIVGADAGGNLVMATGALAGTTGTDGRLTLSSDGTNFYMENRLGAARTWNWRVVA